MAAPGAARRSTFCPRGRKLETHRSRPVAGRSPQTDALCSATEHGARPPGPPSGRASGMGQGAPGPEPAGAAPGQMRRQRPGPVREEVASGRGRSDLSVHRPSNPLIAGRSVPVKSPRKLTRRDVVWRLPVSERLTRGRGDSGNGRCRKSSTVWRIPNTWNEMTTPIANRPQSAACLRMAGSAPERYPATSPAAQPLRKASMIGRARMKAHRFSPAADRAIRAPRTMGSSGVIPRR